MLERKDKAEDGQGVLIEVVVRVEQAEELGHSSSVLCKHPRDPQHRHLRNVPV